jgi:Metallo-peptidase family M12B Reprolysin-like
MPRPFRILAALFALALAAAVLPLAWSSAGAAPNGAIYRPLTGFTPTGPQVRVHPDHYTAVRVDTALVRSALRGAPEAGADGSTVFRVPTPTGGTERFAVQRTQLMQAGLAAAHPEISTWAGRSLDHPGTTIAMDVTPMGFHASVRSGGQGSWYVDPAYNRPGTTAHLSYYGGSLAEQTERVAEREMPQVQRAIAQRSTRSRAAGDAVEQRVYRLALLSDPSYATYFGSANVTAEKTTLMNRVNQIYNDDLAINLVLVNGTDELNLDTAAKATEPNGPCGAHACYTSDPDAAGYVEGQIAFCDVGTLQRNQTVLGQLIGASNYDIGHIMLGVNGGGIAGLGVVGSIEKAMGCTGLPDPTGDFMAIDYVAHEMGHQFGGNHTFNGVQYACSGGNRNAGTSVEPGSGSSVMAYAGICLQDDLQQHTDPYFSQRTLDEANAYTSGAAAPPVEVQDVSLTGFDTDGESIRIAYPGGGAPVTLTRGSTYTAANIESAVEALTGEDVTVAGWGYDPYSQIYNDPPDDVYPAPLTAPDDTGFQVMFAGDPDPYTEDSDRADMADLQVTSSSVGVTVHVGETAKGGEPGNQGFEVNPTDNHDPVVTAPPTRTIPTRTPFTLTGSGTDADGDSLVYLWEQNDDAAGHAGTGLVSNTKRWGPLFRVFGTFANVTDAGTLEYHSPGENLATGSRTRTFPDLAQIMAGNTNARTGKCPAVPPLPDDLADYVPVKPRPRDCYSEFLPTSAYQGAMHFRLTARDQVPGGGGVGFDQVTVRVDRHAGPFLVTSFVKGGKVDGGHKKAVTWKVNGTKKLAHRVRIVLSTDNGRTWKRVLATTANDGRAVVRFPKVKAHKAWLKIQAVDNYFFDLSDHSFRIR